jgi:hypothetical protein
MIAWGHQKSTANSILNPEEAQKKRESVGVTTLELNLAPKYSMQRIAIWGRNLRKSC